MQLVLQASKKT